MKICNIKLIEEDILQMYAWHYGYNQHMLKGDSVDIERYKEYIHPYKDLPLIDKLEQARQKPYTNFDKLKEEITVFEIYKLYGMKNKKWCDKKCKYGQSECEVCVKNWLESEYIEK